MNRPPTKPAPVTPARLARIRKADPELVELLDGYISARLRNITEGRIKLVKRKRLLEQSGAST